MTVKRGPSLIEALVAGSPEALIALTPEGQILFWNAGAEQLFGFTRQEAENHSIYTLVFPPDRIEEARAHMTEALGSGQAMYESVRRRKDGSLFSVDVSLKVIRNGAGDVNFVAVSKRDITPRKNVEQALRSSEERYRRIVETASEGIWMIDAEDRTEYINRRGAEILGYIPAEMLGRRPHDLIHPASDPGDGRRARQMPADGDVRLCRKDASIVWAHVVSTPIISDRGVYAGTLIMFTDITAHKQANDAIRELSSIVQFSDDAIISETLDGIIVSWNAAATRIFGYTPEEAIGRPITMLIPPGRDHESTEFLRRIKRGERVDHYTTVRLRKDGQPIDVSQTLSPIRDAADNIRGASVIARDITEENHLREQLDAIARERAEDLSRYATSIQHVQEDERRRIARELHDDFGQRLTGLKLKVEVFEDDVPDLPSGQSDALKRIKGDIDAMITEVRRISANLRPVALDDFGLVVALQLLCKEFQKSSGTKVDFRANPVEHLDADIEITLYRIAQEALANVARHAAATSVSIQLFNEESGINLVIEDNGKGFDTANLRLHEKTYRGFGLISMRERAQLLGGSVYFSSQKGRGTRIHVEIPPGREHDDETNQDHHRG